jgi:hypothetical protein
LGSIQGPVRVVMPIAWSPDTPCRLVQMHLQRNERRPVRDVSHEQARLESAGGEIGHQLWGSGIEANDIEHASVTGVRDAETR